MLTRRRFLQTAADGQRFLASTPVESDVALTIHIVQNWYEEFRDWEQ